LATGTLCEVVEAEAAFQSVGRGESSQAGSLCDVLCFGSGDGNDNRGGCFAFAFVVRGEPTGFLGEDEARIVGGEFFSNGEEGM
jgi:hypothetical protein